MDTKLFRQKLYLIGLTLLTLACQPVSTLVNSSSPQRLQRIELGDKPLSTFVAPDAPIVRVGVNEPIILTTYHVSRNKLDKLEILVNDQLVRTEDSSAQATTFSPDLSLVQVVDNGEVKLSAASPAIEVAVDDTFVDVVTVNPVKPKSLTSAWTVSLLWRGRVPGTYKVSLQVTDEADRKGEPVVQWIEVR